MDVNRLREAVATEYKIALYRQYREKDAARFWGVDISTVKRWRRERRIPFIEMPNGGIKYLGYQVVDVLILGSQARLAHGSDRQTREALEPDRDLGEMSTAWPNIGGELSNAVTGTSANEASPPLGTERDMTPAPDRQNASASAQLTKLLRKND